MGGDPVRIALVGAARAGLTTVAQELASRLAAAGLAVSVFRAVHERGVAKEARRGGMSRSVIFTPRLGVLTAFVEHALIARRVAHAFDLVYVLGGGSTLSGVWPRLFGANVWIRLEDIACRRPRRPVWQRVVEWTALQVADVIVVDTQAALAGLRERHRHLPPVLVNPWGAEVIDHADPEPLADWELAPGCYYLVMCQTMPEHHLREIIAGFLAAHSTFPLVIVGDIAEEARHGSDLHHLAGARVRFIGDVPEGGRLCVLRCHARAYFHAHSSTDESLLQALACGTVIIARDSACNRETAGDTARYFRSTDDLAVAVAWAEELEGVQRRACAAAAQARVRARHGWDGVVDRYLCFLRLLGPRLP